MNAVSLFSGIGGIDRALERAGIPVVAAVEIDPACRDILARHFPHAALFDDVTKVTGDDLLAAGFVPDGGLLAAGWPCQGNSMAGRRGGMADPRSGLWRHVVRLLAETRASWFLGENVPGLLSVNDGEDIAVVRGDLAQLGYWWAERILDAQYFGVPQRRRRVFFVGCAGDRHAVGPVQILLEPESGDGDPAAGRSAWPGTAAASDGRTVGTLQGGGRRGHRVDAESAAGGQLIPLPVAYAFTSRNDRNDREENWVVPLAVRGREGGAQLEAGQSGDPAFTVRTPGGGSSQPLIAHSLTAEGADASEDGTGRGTPLVVDTLRSHPRPGSNSLGAVVAAPLTSGSHTPGVSAPGRRQEDDTNLWVVSNDSTPVVGNDTVSTLKVGTGLGIPSVPAVTTAAAVRRLTPLECERLQGFPDNWTAGQSDSTRYRQLGNAVAVPCVEWIARRIALAVSP